MRRRFSERDGVKTPPPRAKTRGLAMRESGLNGSASPIYISNGTSLLRKRNSSKKLQQEPLRHGRRPVASRWHRAISTAPRPGFSSETKYPAHRGAMLSMLGERPSICRRGVCAGVTVRRVCCANAIRKLSCHHRHKEYVRSQSSTHPRPDKSPPRPTHRPCPSVQPGCGLPANPRISHL